jgi:two-component system, response regulator
MTLGLTQVIDRLCRSRMQGCDRASSLDEPGASINMLNPQASIPTVGVNASAEPLPPNEPMLREKRAILLVEDNDFDAELAARAFQHVKVPYSLVRARDGLDALDYLFGRGKYATRDVHFLPVFALLDLKIPKIGGLDVLKAIRADERTRHLPVIVLTSSSEERDLLGAYNHFANSYIVKPLDFDQFVAATLQLSLYWTRLNEPAPLKEA